MNVVVVQKTDVGKGGNYTFITVYILYCFDLQTIYVSLGPLRSRSQDGTGYARDWLEEMPGSIKGRKPQKVGTVFRLCRSDRWQRGRVAKADLKIAVQF